MKTAQKIDYINFLQSFAVTLVIIGHCLPKPNGTEMLPLWAKIIHDMIYSFHMPLFFVLAGFLFINSFYRQSNSIQNFANFISTKFIRLIIPYFSIGTLAYLLKVLVFNRFAYRPASADIVSYIKSMLIPWDNPNIYLWFLPTIFFVFLFSYLVLDNDNYKKFNPIIWVILSFIVSFLSYFTHITWLNISGILYYLFYFFVGVLLFYSKDLIIKILLNNGIMMFLILLFLEIQIIPTSQICNINNILHYVLAILGILISFSLSMYCCKHNIKFLWGIIDGKYYQIYLLSWFFQCGMRILYQINIVSYVTMCFLMLIASFVFPLLIISFVQRLLPKFKIFIGL